MKITKQQFENSDSHCRRRPERSRFSGGAKDLARIVAATSVALLVLLTSSASAQDIPMFRWENFTTANGLPDNHVYSVLVDGKRIWVGTDNGLGLYENCSWKIFRPADGLSHQAVLS